MTINVTNVDERPVFTGGGDEVEISENSPTTTVVETYTATDDEDRKRNRSVKWSVSDTTNFSIGNTARNRGRADIQKCARL